MLALGIGMSILEILAIHSSLLAGQPDLAALLALALYQSDFADSL